MPKPEKEKPRLKNLDELFKLNNGVTAAPENKQPAAERNNTPSTISLDLLSPFPGHPFRLYEGERLEDMVESIKSNGVLVPIIARKRGAVYELLSGHNRVNAAKQAGLDVIPAIILENVSDDEAWIYVTETNLMQRSFSDMAHSEKAAVIAIQHSKLFSQGKRNDILAELQMLENPHEYKENETSVEISQKLDSRDSIAREYGLKPFCIAQYLRIHQLSKLMKERLDNGEFALTAAVTLSFLNENEQNLLDKCMGLNRFKVDMKKADILRQYSENGKLDEDCVYLILSGEVGKKPKPNRTPTVKVSKAVFSKYFRPNQPAKEIQGIVEKALDMYFRKNK